MREHGRILAVTEERAGSFLTAPAAPNDVLLSVVDASAFSAGTLQIDDTDNGEQLAYSAATDGVISLSSAVQFDHPADTPVSLVPSLRVRWAYVGLDDASLPPVTARVPYAISGQIPLGQRSEVIGEDDNQALTSEEVIIELVRGTWMVLDVIGVAKVLSDGVAPISSPDADAQGGVGYIVVRWPTVANDDLITYEVHVSTSDGFTPDSTTLVGEMTGTMFFIHNLPDHSPLQYNTPYYVRLVARDTDGTATAGNQAEAVMVPATSLDIAVNAITADHILAGSVTVDKLESVLSLTGELIVGPEGGQHVWMRPDIGIRLYAADGQSVLIDLPTDPAKSPYFSGKVVAEELDAIGGVHMRGSSSSVSSGGTLTLESGITDPVASPSVALSYPISLVLEGNADHYGLFYDDVDDAFWMSAPSAAGTYRYIQQFDAASGSKNTTLDIGQGNDAWGVCRIGDDLFVLWSPDDTITWRLARYDLSLYQSSGFVRTGLFTLPSARIQNNSPGMFTDGQNLYVITTDGNASASRLRLQVFDTGGGVVQAINLDPSFVVDGRGFQADQGTEFGGGVLLTEPGVNGGNPVYWIAMYSYDGASRYHRGVIPFDAASGTIVANAEFFGAQGAEADGIAYDGTNFHSLVWNGPVLQHSNWTWTTESDVYWVGYTWANATHETAVSPRAALTMRRRAYLTVSWPTIPTTINPVDPELPNPDDPDRVLVYMNRSDTDPQSNGRFAGQFQGTYTSGPVVFSGLAAGAQNPPSNTFPVSVPAILRTALGGFRLLGDGTFVMPHSDARPANPVEGQAWYDTNTHSEWRYDGFMWTPITDGGPTMQKYAHMSEDFRQAVSSGAAPQANIGYGAFFAYSVTNGGSIGIIMPDAATHPGVAELATGGANNSTVRFFSSNVLFGNGTYHYTAWVYVPTVASGTETFFAICGYANNNTPTSATHGAFIYSEAGATPHWRGAVCDNAFDSSPTDLGLVTAAVWTRLDVVVHDDATTVDFYVNEGLTQRTGTQAPTVPGREAAIRVGIVKTAGTTSRSLYVDAVSHAQSMANDGR